MPDLTGDNALKLLFYVACAIIILLVLRKINGGPLRGDQRDKH
jgi:hypothetical protein